MIVQQTMTPEPETPRRHNGRVLAVWLIVALALIAAVAVVGRMRSTAAAQAERQAAAAERAIAERESRLAGPPAFAGRVHSIIFCRTAERGTVGLDVRDVFNELAVPTFPAKMTFTVVVAVTTDKPGRRHELVVKGTDRAEPGGHCPYRWHRRGSRRNDTSARAAQQGNAPPA